MQVYLKNFVVFKNIQQELFLVSEYKNIKLNYKSIFKGLFTVIKFRKSSRIPTGFTVDDIYLLKQK